MFFFQQLISLMMGSNTFCLELCYDDHTKIAQKHRESIIKALLYIKEHLPRTIVNLILSPSMFNLFIYFICYR